MDIREIISDRMGELGTTQRQLQALTGVHQVRISDYLTGKRDMNGDNVAKLLEALGLEITSSNAKRRRARGTPKAATPRRPLPRSGARRRAAEHKGM